MKKMRPLLPVLDSAALVSTHPLLSSVIRIMAQYDNSLKRIVDQCCVSSSVNSLARIQPFLQAHEMIKPHLDSIQSITKQTTDFMTRSFPPGLAAQITKTTSILDNLDKNREMAMIRPRKEDIRIDVNADLLQRIKELEEEKEELQRHVVLLKSKVKPDYIG